MLPFSTKFAFVKFTFSGALREEPLRCDAASESRKDELSGTPGRAGWTPEPNQYRVTKSESRR